MFDTRSPRPDRRPTAEPPAVRRGLAQGYTSEVDTVSDADWYEHVATFSDANLYQLWRHATHPVRPGRVSRLLLRRGEQVVAAVEVRLFRMPLTKRGIAWVRWGPLWKRGGDDRGIEVLRQALSALHDEYVVRRRLILRIAPRLILDDGPDYSSVVSDEGFSSLGDLVPDRTLILPLAGEIAELRRSLAQKWRNSLNKAEKSGLSVVSGAGLDLFDEFTRVYTEMLRRKDFAPTADIDKHRRLQAVLPERMKMGVLIARHEGRACAGVIYSALGDTAVYLFGATNETGMRTSASYLLQWETVKILKASGIVAYDLHGINPKANPGTYHFKKGLAGKHGTEATFVGQFQAFHASPVNRLLLALERLRRRRLATRAARGARPAAASADTARSET
jgi:hypothetical protein